MLDIIIWGFHLPKKKKDAIIMIIAELQYKKLKYNIRRKRSKST